jgi:hypothetical protein
MFGNLEQRASNKSIQRTAKSVPPFATAKATPLFATADAGRYVKRNKRVR